MSTYIIVYEELKLSVVVQLLTLWNVPEHCSKLELPSEQNRHEVWPCSGCT